MVDIIDLLDDSSDDEIESRPTVSRAKPTVTQSDDDNEVLWIPKPIARASSSNKNNATINSKPNPSTRRSSVLDSDDESDDDFLLSSLPGGLSRAQCKASSKTPSQSWRIQSQLNTSIARKEVNTPIVSNGVTPCATNSSGRKPIRNPYAKTKTPPIQNISSGATQLSSGKSHFASSSSKDLSTPFVPKTRTIVKNPYSSSGKKAGTTRSGNSMEAAVATRQVSTCGIRPPKLRARTKPYPDLRPNIVLALWKYARKNLVRDSYQGRRLDQFIGRIVDLVVSAPDFPIRSATIVILTSDWLIKVLANMASSMWIK